MAIMVQVEKVTLMDFLIQELAGIDGIATFIPPSDAPSVMYYYSQPESGMGGIIGITSA